MAIIKLISLALEAFVSLYNDLKVWIPELIKVHRESKDETRALRISQQRAASYEYAKEKARLSGDSSEFNRLIRNPPSFDD